MGHFDEGFPVRVSAGRSPNAISARPVAFPASRSRCFFGLVVSRSDDFVSLRGASGEAIAPHSMSLLILRPIPQLGSPIPSSTVVSPPWAWPGCSEVCARLAAASGGREIGAQKITQILRALFAIAARMLVTFTIYLGDDTLPPPNFWRALVGDRGWDPWDGGRGAARTNLARGRGSTGGDSSWQIVR